MDRSKRDRLLSLAALAKGIAGLARVLARDKETWICRLPESWGDGYNRLFDEFDATLRELEGVRNPDNLAPGHPDRSKAGGLLDSTTDSVVANASAVLRLHDQIAANRRWHSFGGRVGVVRVLTVEPDALTRLQDVADCLERNLLGNGIEDRQCVSPSPVSGHPVLNLKDLGIGFDEVCYWAFSPCPTTGEIVRLTSDHSLRLPGKRWPAVLQCFARSDDGKTARKSELITVLGLQKRGKYSTTQTQADRLTQHSGRAPRTLSSTMAYLGRKLRKALRAEGGLTVFDGQENSDYYHAFFTCRGLLRGEDGAYRFGSPAS
jgi:hypothetical protein